MSTAAVSAAASEVLSGIAPQIKGGRILEHPEAVRQGIPSALDWSEEELGIFASVKAKSKTEAAWYIGKACEERKKQGAGFSEWRKKYLPLISERTLDRYQGMAETFSLDDIEGKSQTVVYRLLYGRPEPRKRSPKQEKEGAATFTVKEALPKLLAFVEKPDPAILTEHRADLQRLAYGILELLMKSK